MHKRLLVSVLGLCSLLRVAAAFPATRLHEVQNIELRAVSGPIDHMAADVAGAKLFVAAGENHSVEAVDLKLGRVVTRVTGLKQPQRIALIPLTPEIRRLALLSSRSGIPEGQELIVTNARDLHADVYDGPTFLPIKQIEVEQNQGDIQFDARVGRAYIGGESGGEPVLAVIDESYVKVQEIRLSGRPASFQLESNDNRIFVNLPTMGIVAVVDRMQGQVVASWQLSARGNFAMALDEAHHRLFVSARDPARLLVLDTQTGRTVASLDCVGDADDIFYAADSGLIYVSGGQGFIDVFHQISPDNYELVEKVPTAKRARTSLYVPQWHRLFVAIPGTEGVRPQIRVYEAEGL
jgi:hypothetical protein